MHAHPVMALCVSTCVNLIIYISPVILPQLIKQTVHIFCQLEFMTLNFQALNTPTMGTSLFDVTVTFKQQGKIETILFLKQKIFFYKKIYV